MIYILYRNFSIVYTMKIDFWEKKKIYWLFRITKEVYKGSEKNFESFRYSSGGPHLHDS